MVNEAFAKKFYAGENPIGKTFVWERFGRMAEHDRQFEIVGLVADAKYRTLREEPQPTFYAPIGTDGGDRLVSPDGDQDGRAPWSSRQAILHAIAGVNKEIVVDFRTLDEDIGAAVMQERLIASLSAFFGGLALLLAALGLYGVMSYSVSRRTQRDRHSHGAWRGARHGDQRWC